MEATGDFFNDIDEYAPIIQQLKVGLTRLTQEYDVDLYQLYSYVDQLNNTSLFTVEEIIELIEKKLREDK